MTGGIGLLVIVALLVAVWLAVEYRAWQHRDQDRRLKRLRDRKLA